MNDNRLVYLAKNYPESGAFEILYKKYEGYLMTSVNKYVPRNMEELRTDVISLLNESFWKAVCNFDPKRGVKFSTYLYGSLIHPRSVRIAIQDSSLIHTPRDREPKMISFDFDSETFNTPGSIDQKLITRMDLENAVNKLKSERLKNIIYYHLIGLENTECAGLMNLSRCRVAQVKQEAFYHLKEHLQDYKPKEK